VPGLGAIEFQLTPENAVCESYQLDFAVTVTSLTPFSMMSVATQVSEVSKETVFVVESHA
jgi:hypothetical protein